MKFREPKQSKPIPVLLDKALRDRIEAVSRKMGEPKSTVMRIAMRIGLEGLDKVFEKAPELAKGTTTYPQHKEEQIVVEEKPDSTNASTTEETQTATDFLKKHVLPEVKPGAPQKSKK